MPEEPKVLLKILADSEDQQDRCLVPPIQVTSAGPPGLSQQRAFLARGFCAWCAGVGRQEGAEVSPLYAEVQIGLSHNLDVNVAAQKDLQAGPERMEAGRMLMAA